MQAIKGTGRDWRRAIGGLAMAVTVTVLPAVAQDCGAQTTTAAMRACTDAALVAETAAMDDALSALLERVDPARSALLIKAQAAWTVWRDREAAVAASLAEGGTLAPLLAASEALALTRVRRARLEAALAEED